MWGMSARMCTQSFVALRCVESIKNFRELITTRRRTTTKVAFRTFLSAYRGMQSSQQDVDWETDHLVKSYHKLCHTKYKLQIGEGGRGQQLPIQVDSRPAAVRRGSALIKINPGELSQWLYCDGTTIIPYT